MKILWFTNTACSAAEKLGINVHRGGWLKSLEEEIALVDEIELSICFYASKSFDPFTINRTTYYPITRKNTASKTGRYLNRIFRTKHMDEPEIAMLLSVITQVKPDLIHIHGTEENFGLIQQRLSIPVIVSIQGLLTPYHEKYYSGIPSVIASRYEAITEKISFKSAAYLYEKLTVKAAREREILRTTRYVIGRTDWDKRVTRVLSPKSTYFYNNEILRASFYDAQWTKKGYDIKRKIITISSGALFKGFETIVKVAQILCTYPDFSFEWLVVGLNEQSNIVSTVKRWLKADFSSLNIILLGSEDEEKVAKRLCASDIYVQVSHIENSPNSLCEAMLVGMPVIASYAGGTGSLLENEVDGILVQDGDPYAMAGAVIELSDNFSLASNYGKHARERATRRHNRKQIAHDLTEVYAKIIKENKQS